MSKTLSVAAVRRVCEILRNKVKQACHKHNDTWDNTRIAQENYLKSAVAKYGIDKVATVKLESGEMSFKYSKRILKKFAEIDKSCVVAAKKRADVTLEIYKKIDALEIALLLLPSTQAQEIVLGLQATLEGLK